jgi:hypothetical protein
MAIALIAFALQATPAATDSTWDRLQFDANGRMRWESTFDQPSGEDRHRGRFRARVGAKYAILPELGVQARLSTASDGSDANNPHWDFGDGPDGFNGADVALDRFFLSWKPAKSVDVRAGKQPHALQGPPVAGEFLWDEDVNPSGLSVTWAPVADADKSFDLRAAEYVAVEASNDNEPTMFGLQAHGRLRFSDKAILEGATAYMDWANTADFANAASSGNQGNTSLSEDFGIWDTWIAATLGEGLAKTTVFGQLINNTEDDTGEDQGTVFGARLGNSGKQGDWNVFGSLYDLDANAVFSPVAQDDTPIAGTGIGTGMDGLIAGGQYFVRDNLSLKLWVLTSDADAADDPFRIRFDLDFIVK